MAIVTESTQKLSGASAIAPERLAYELAIRGKGWKDLRPTLSINTVTKLRAGVRVDELHPSTLEKLADWLRATPIEPSLEAVIRRPGSGTGADS